MAIHQSNPNKRPDSDFVAGCLAHIVAGNSGRLLDGRRTPGYIESYDANSAMFVWRITDFEDKGRCWEIAAEKVTSYQFEKDCQLLPEDAIAAIQKRCDELDKMMVITSDDATYQATQEAINKRAQEAMKWLKSHGAFVQHGAHLGIKDAEGNPYLYADLVAYMGHHGLDIVEQKTADQWVLNPYSGEWIKGMRIVMAEMGLIDPNEKIPRTGTIFEGLGDKAIRRNYIIHRMAFVQAYFALLGMDSVTLYRGMSSYSAPRETPRTLMSTTLSLEVAQSFADMDSTDEGVTYSYCIRFDYPVRYLFMTYYETEAFNGRYMEQEALVLYREKLCI